MIVLINIDFENLATKDPEIWFKNVQKNLPNNLRIYRFSQYTHMSCFTVQIEANYLPTQ